MIILKDGKVKSVVHLGVGMLLLLLLEVNCDNYTQKYSWNSFQTRENRLISFHTLDQGDIELELEFHVPFLTIPIKKTMSGALANINVGAIALTGAIVFGAVVALPGLIALLNKKGSEWSSTKYKTTSADSTNNNDDTRMQMMMMMMNGDMDGGTGAKMNNDSAMKMTDTGRDVSSNEKENSNSSSGSGTEKRNKRYDDPLPPSSSSSSSNSYDWLQLLLTNLDGNFLRDMRSTACLQRAICWTVRNSASRTLSTSTQAASSTSVDKIIDGLATNEWVRYWAKDSLFDSAIQFGLRRSNCAKVFSECRLSQSVISMLVKKFTAIINNA